MNALEKAIRSTSPACIVCSDLRIVLQSNGREAMRCPRCGVLNEESYTAFMAAHAAGVREKPALCQLDLTVDEIEYMREQKVALGGKAHNLTILSWIEGRRYDPSRDPELVALVNERVAAERRKMEEKHADLPTR